MGTETKFNCLTEKTSTDSSGGEIKDCYVSQKNICMNGTANGKDKSPLKNGGEASSTNVSKPELIPTSVTVPFVPILVDENNVIEGAKEILKVIRPTWDLKKVQFKRFTDGITNKLVGCFYTGCNETLANNCTNGHSNHVNLSTEGDSSSQLEPNAGICNSNNESTDNLSDSGSESEGITSSSSESSNNVVLVRVYGNKTDLLIDRKAETRNILLLHSYGFAPSLYATFKNGLAYDYVPGVTLNTSNVMQPEVWRLVACRMAEMHRYVNPLNSNVPIIDGKNGGGIDGIDGSRRGNSSNNSENSGNCKNDGISLSEIQDRIVPMLWKKTQSFFDLVPERFSNADKHKRLQGTFLPISRMRKEFEELYSRLESLGSPLVFSHNDLLLGNVVYTESMNTVNFIDYEYADINFQAFDIGNHFAEFAGVDEVDYSRYPSYDYQIEWLRVYLEAYLGQSNVSNEEIQRLYVQVNQFSLAAHFFWTIWSLIQAEHSTIEFDYVDYAFVRYNEYLAKKETFLALDKTSS